MARTIQAASFTPALCPLPDLFPASAAVSTVKQRLLFVGREEGKLLALRQLISEGLRPPVLVFVATKERAKELHRWALGHSVIVCGRSDRRVRVPGAALAWEHVLLGI